MIWVESLSHFGTAFFKNKNHLNINTWVHQLKVKYSMLCPTRSLVFLTPLVLGPVCEAIIKVVFLESKKFFYPNGFFVKKSETTLSGLVFRRIDFLNLLNLLWVLWKFIILKSFHKSIHLGHSTTGYQL